MYPMYLSSDYEDQAINLNGESGVYCPQIDPL